MAKEKSNTQSPTNEMRYTSLPDRMPPIPGEKMTSAQKQAVAEMCSGPRGAIRGPYWPILRSPGYMRPMQKVGEYFRYDSPVAKRISEMAALIVARDWTQQFEWDVHLPTALNAGLKPAIAAAISEGRRPEQMGEDEEILYDLLAELRANKSVSDATYARAIAEFGEAGIIDILGVVGYFTTLATIMNVSRAPTLDGKSMPLMPIPDQLRRVAS